jgi:YfiH family protein
VPVLVTGRAGGVSAAPYHGLNLGDHVGDEPAAVAANRRRLAAQIGLPVQYMRQVHGAHVAVVRGPVPPPEADALVTDTPGLALAVLVADCVPVLFEAAGAVGVAHAGRAGMASGVLPATLAAFGRLGADPAGIHVTLGPGVCGSCYEVPAAMRAEVTAAVPGSAAVTRAGTPSIDLRAGLIRQLRDAGVASLTVSDRCTVEDAALFSHRRDGRTGRFAGLAWLSAPAPVGGGRQEERRMPRPPER